MKAILLCVIICFTQVVKAQNVGINKTNPAHSLDVNGNVNVDGKILLNAVAGNAGQVLSTNAFGVTEWASFSHYTYWVNFSQSGNFVVPAGVMKVLIEAWGAGGGGSSGGGGSAGMYVTSVQDVTPGESLTITVGTGGSKASTNPGAAANGTGSTVSGAFGIIMTTGGRGAFATAPGYTSRYGSSGGKYLQFPGQNGESNTFSYAQKNATTFAIIRKYGDGGAAGPAFNWRSQGETRSVNENTGLLIESNNPTFAPYPGGGGGGGFYGEDGADGMVVIRY